jgi:CopG family nickel-responsive transcriptional regulator
MNRNTEGRPPRAAAGAGRKRTNAMPRKPLDTAIARLSISLPEALLRQLDAMVGRRALPNRSQVVAEMIRHELAEQRIGDAGAVLAGTVTLIYRSDRGRVRQALARTQSDFVKEVISSQHVFLENDQSLEVLLVQGSAARLQRLCDGLRKIRGVLQARLVTTTALLPPLHARAPARKDTPTAGRARK